MHTIHTMYIKGETLSTLDDTISFLKCIRNLYNKLSSLSKICTSEELKISSWNYNSYATGDLLGSSKWSFTGNARIIFIMHNLLSKICKDENIKKVFKNNLEVSKSLNCSSKTFKYKVEPILCEIKRFYDIHIIDNSTLKVEHNSSDLPQSVSRKAAAIPAAAKPFAAKPVAANPVAKKTVEEMLAEIGSKSSMFAVREPKVKRGVMTIPEVKEITLTNNGAAKLKTTKSSAIDPKVTKW